MVVVAAADAVGIATDRYFSAVFERSGWGNPFTPPPDDAVDGAESESEDESESQDLIRVTADYILEVVSPDELRRLVDARKLPYEVGPGNDESTVADLVAALFEGDGWDPAAYGEQVMHVRQSDWSVGQAEDTGCVGR